MAEQPNTTEDQTPKQYLSVREVAERYDVGESTLYRNVRLGRFPAPVKICGMNRWHIDSLPKQEVA